MKKFLKFILIIFALIIAISSCVAVTRRDKAEETTQKSENTESVRESTTKDKGKGKDEASYSITLAKANTWTSRANSQWTQVIVEITNTGKSNLYISSGAYDLEDESGKLIASRKYVSSYPDVIAPGEKAYMYDETTLDDTVDGELSVVPHVDVKKAQVDLVRFPVTEVSFSDDEIWGIRALGRIENTSQETQKLTYVSIALYNISGECIGVLSTTVTEDIAPNGKIGFETTSLALPDNVTADAIASYTAYAYPLQLQFS